MKKNVFMMLVLASLMTVIYAQRYSSEPDSIIAMNPEVNFLKYSNTINAAIFLEEIKGNEAVVKIMAVVYDCLNTEVNLEITGIGKEIIYKKEEKTEYEFFNFTRNIIIPEGERVEVRIVITCFFHDRYFDRDIKRVGKIEFVNKGDEVIYGEGVYCNIRMQELLYEKRKKGYVNYTQEQLEIYDPDLAQRIREFGELDSWDKTIIKRDLSGKIREIVILHPEVEGKKIEIRTKDENDESKDTVLILQYNKDNDKVEIYNYVRSLNIKLEIQPMTSIIELKSENLNLLNYKNPLKEVTEKMRNEN